jgi:hypothetical protein
MHHSATHVTGKDNQMSEQIRWRGTISLKRSR